jgi:hypothetical protein
MYCWMLFKFAIVEQAQRMDHWGISNSVDSAWTFRHLTHLEQQEAAC